MTKPHWNNESEFIYAFLNSTGHKVSVLYLCALAFISSMYTFGIGKQFWTAYLVLARRWHGINVIPNICDHFPISPNVVLTPVVPKSAMVDIFVPQILVERFWKKCISSEIKKNNFLTCWRELHPNGQHDQEVAIQVGCPMFRRELMLLGSETTDKMQMADLTNV